MYKLRIVFVMVLWGSIGVFTRFIAISPILLAFLRASIALPVIIIYGLATRSLSLKNASFKDVFPFILSGIIMGFSWLTLFIGFASTDIAASIIAFNMCPVYVLLLAPLLLKERLRAHHIVTVILAFAGLFLIVYSSLDVSKSRISGLLFAIASGVLYAFFVIVNRKATKCLTNTTVTTLQMGSASIVILPFVLFGNLFADIGSIDTRALVMLLVLGIVHTGIAYLLYFPVYTKLNAVLISILGYIEPASGMAFAALLLGEALTLFHIAGGLLILGSTLFCVVYENRKSKAGLIQELP